MCSQRRVPCRSMSLGCPLARVSSDSNPAERSQRFALPPPCCWAHSSGVFCWMSSGGFRFKPVGCPRGRFPCDPNPAERTRRSAPPPPVFWSLATVVFRGGSSGISAACDSAPQWNGCPMIQIQRSGHRGPRSCDPLSGPWPRWSLVEDPGGVPIQDCCLTSGTGVCTGLPYGGLGRAASPPFVFRPLSFDRTFELSTTSHDGRLEADFSVRRQISGLSATPTPRAVHWAR